MNKLRNNFKLSPGKRTFLKIVLIAALLSAVAYGLFRAYSLLYALWHDQCLLREDAQIEIVTTPNIKPNLVRESFNLKIGTNLADIDFKANLIELLSKYPVFREIRITRKLPGKVRIAVEERKPIARINFSRLRGTWDVVDKDAIVYSFPLSESASLPVIKEKSHSAKRGTRLTDRALIALRLIEIGMEREFAAAQLTNVDISNETYLIAYTRDHETIKITWDYIKSNGASDLGNMREAIRNICRVISNDNLKSGRQTYIVTGKGRITVSPYNKEPIK